MNRALRRAAPVALASAAALLLAGCAGSSEPEASETPRRGGRLHGRVVGRRSATA